MKLSLCVAAYNEESFIHYPLDSAYDFVDEIIIVDGGSTDKTVEIVKKYGDKVKVFHEDNPPMFHINKQKAVEKARGEWILQLDADEAVSNELKSEIMSIIHGKHDQSYLLDPVPHQPHLRKDLSDRAPRFVPPKNKITAYWVPRKNYFLGRFLMKGGVYPDYTIRLYKNGKAHFPCVSVHENVAVDGEVGYLKSAILHYADPNFGRYLKRWNRYTTLDASDAIKNNQSLNPISFFVFKPLKWFLMTYLRHQGFRDGFPGFVFSFFSSIRFWAIYFKWKRMQS